MAKVIPFLRVIRNPKRLASQCRSVRFELLSGGTIRCADCGKVAHGYRWIHDGEPPPGVA